MPNPTTNTMTLRAKAASGPNSASTTAQPRQIRWLKREGRTIVLQAHPSNNIPVTITFNQARANTLFAVPVPVSPIVLDAANSSASFVLKPSLGIQERANLQNSFDDENPAFARTFHFEHEPGSPGGGGDHDAWHIEC